MPELHERCRHWNPEKDYCVELKILAPRRRCEDCPMLETTRTGLGDVVEKVLDLGTMGRAKVVAKKVSGGDCGCNKRRAKLNRATDTVKRILRGDQDGN